MPASLEARHLRLGPAALQCDEKEAGRLGQERGDGVGRAVEALLEGGQVGAGLLEQGAGLQHVEIGGEAGALLSLDQIVGLLSRVDEAAGDRGRLLVVARVDVLADEARKIREPGRADVEFAGLELRLAC